MKELAFETKAICEPLAASDAQRTIRYPVYNSVAFDFETAEDLAAAFAGEKKVHSYSRLSNPTVEAFERKMTALENGLGSIAFSSGMAAITNLMLSLMQADDNIIASNFLFGNTYALMKSILPQYGLQTRFVDITNDNAIEQAIDDKTRLIFLEAISNPCMIVPDIKKISQIAKERNVVLVVDATLVTPWLFKALDFGVDLVVHSTTKFISGGATSVGGAIVDLGTFDWSGIPSLQEFHQLKEGAFLARTKKDILRNLGACMSPQVAFLQSLGLETLSLRVDKSSDNALRIAHYLDEQPSVKSVLYPGMASSAYYELTQRQFAGKAGGLFSFELQGRQQCFEFMNRLQLIHRATNLNDNHSLIIHPASTIYRDFSVEERKTMGVSDGLIRLSVGIENADDLIADLDQALALI